MLKSGVRFVVALMIISYLSSCDKLSQPQETEFDGIKFLQRGIRIGSLSLGENISQVAFELKRYQFEVLSNKREDLKSLKSLAKKTRDFFVVNANFFDEKHEPLGLVISKGRVVQEMHQGGDLLNGVLVRYSDGTKIVSRSLFDMSGAIEAVQSGPILLQDGIAAKLDSIKKSVRIAVCSTVLEEKAVLSFVLHVRPVSLGEFAEKLRDLSCQDALNLDGGGSAQMLFRQQGTDLVNHPGKVRVPILIRMRPFDNLKNNILQHVDE